MQTEIQENFIQTVMIHKKIIYKVCHVYCKQHDDKKDLAQEIIYQLWRSFASYKKEYKISTWVYRISLNVAISFYRSKKRNSHIILTEHAIDIEDGTPDPSDKIELLYTFINQLDPLNKAVMLLYLDSSSYKEIGEVLGISETNVATKLNRIKEKLRTQIKTI